MCSSDLASVRLGQSSISFDVPQEAIGRPVLVRVSYFPNWSVHGATGPYRAAPNFMVVVPTSTHVKLTYGYSGLDLGSYALTLAGIALLVFFWRRRQVDFSRDPVHAEVADGNTGTDEPTPDVVPVGFASSATPDPSNADVGPRTDRSLSESGPGGPLEVSEPGAQGPEAGG